MNMVSWVVTEDAGSSLGRQEGSGGRRAFTTPQPRPGARSQWAELAPHLESGCPFS